MKRIFLDTNILVYAYDGRVPATQRRAQEVIADLKQPDCLPCLSTQVLQEFYNALTRKLGFTPADAAAELRVLTALDTVIITPDLILAAAALHASASLSFWDSLIIAAAQARQCAELWSEDLQDGRKFGNLEIVNPLVRR
jgi:predicted nucleic acid-binding protein